MKELIIGLTTSSIEQIILDMVKYCHAIGKLLQHKLLISDTILNMYCQHFEKIDELRLFEKWFEEVNRYDSFEYLDSIEGENEVIIQMEKLSNHMVITTATDIVNSANITPIKLNELNSLSINTPLDWYCIPFNTIIRKDTDISVFFDWLKDLLFNETKITIIDPYICKKDCRKMFTDLLMKSIPSNAKVAIYFDGSKTDQSDITYLKKQYGNRLTMHTSSFKEDGHDRYIYCDSFVISVGIGLDVFVYNTKKTRKETSISLTNADRPTLPSTYKQPCYR